MTRAARADRVLIRDVRCDGTMLFVLLSDGRSLGTPLLWCRRLLRAKPEQRANWELLGPGIGIHWPDVDEDLALEGMLAGRAAPGVET